MSNLTENDQPQKQALARVEVEKPAVPDWEKIWQVLGPILQPVMTAAIAALERTNRHSGMVTGGLLAMVIISLTGLAYVSLTLGRVDTAEKIIIAMVSFLGGAAIFSGPPKK